MTPSERALLSQLGMIIIGRFWSMTTLILLMGIFIGLFSFTAYLMLKKGITAYSRRALFGISAFNFLVACVYCSIWWTVVYLGISPFRNRTAGKTLREKILADNLRIPTLIIPLDWFHGLLPIVTDIVTIWRAKVLFPERRWGAMLAILLCIAGLVVVFVEAGITSNQPDSRHSSTDKLLYTLEGVSVVLSFATNFVATSTIAYGVWSYRQFFVTRLNAQDQRKFQVHKILHLLVESGLAYCVLQALALIFVFMSEPPPLSAKHVVGDVITQIYLLVSAMYPSLIALIVNIRGDFTETYTFQSDQHVA